MNKIPVKSAKIYTRDGSEYRIITLSEDNNDILSLTLYRGEICLEAIVWKNSAGFSGSGKKKLRIRPENYGLGSKRGVFDKDIVSFRKRGKKYIGEVDFSLEALIKEENAWTVISEDGEIFRLSEISNLKTIGTKMAGDEIEDFLEEISEISEVSLEPDYVPPFEDDLDNDQISMSFGAEDEEKGSNLIFYTDGSSLGNPGPCAGAYIMLKDGKIEKEEKIPLGKGTNNIAEMMAVIRALEEADRYSPSSVLIRSDSQYVIKGITEWSNNWEKNGWKKSDGEGVLNADLWKQMKSLSRKMPVEFEWVKGHNKNEYNERADELAVDAARTQRRN